MVASLVPRHSNTWKELLEALFEFYHMAWQRGYMSAHDHPSSAAVMDSNDSVSVANNIFV